MISRLRQIVASFLQDLSTATLRRNLRPNVVTVVHAGAAAEVWRERRLLFPDPPPHPAIQRGGRPAKLPTLLNNIFSFQLWQQYLLFFLHSYPM
jgi:hypothetical protein